MSRRVRLFLWIALPLGAVLLGLGTAVTFDPPLLTGYYARVTITSLQIDKEGQVELAYDYVSSANTYLSDRLNMVDGVGKTYGGSCCWGPAWEFHNNHGLALNLLGPGEDRRDRKIPDRTTLAKRMLVEVGQTYEVRVDRPLSLYRFTDGDGHVHEGEVFIYPAPVFPL